MPPELDNAIEDRHENYSASDRNWTEHEDADVFYSFDASSGPVRSDQVLGAAVNEAVERFEIKETRRLVREYEFVPHEDPNNEDDHSSTDEDGFEIINPVKH